MIIGIPKEIKNNEYRVASTPVEVEKLVSEGHTILIEKNAGLGAGYSNKEYLEAGAKIFDNVKDIYKKSKLIYKVKEILPPEYNLIREDHIIFTYIHSNADIEQTDMLLNSEATAIAYEDIQDEDSNYPLLEPMSELAGKGGFLKALEYSQKINGGNGVLLSRVAGCETPKVTIIGGGTAGLGAAELASSFGNKVTILDIDINRLTKLKDKLPRNVELLYSDRNSIENCLKTSDVLINCVLWPKSRKDHLVSKEDLKLMKRDSLIIDVSCDENGAIETSRPTSHDEPIYEIDGIIHYAVDNIPAAFSKTATKLLSKATLPYSLEIANKGIKKALVDNKYLRKGLTCYNGKLTLEETGRKQNRDYISPEKALNIINDSL